ncbi:hypothetical protein SAMN05660337_2354 [Maridesulfovibrio ferrireducens]|uniref:Uncharacterized protein n=1 Tax=Maridesulfovibrio ferrireducens TaxID=246191 RepID=A0A1G9HXK1_9BACT|nr:hypothetical protein [Maridesulfovibrio ferrireducens]SDL17555.1 hypothetical protein SAMN05660337_2354 [Maridesulfovibrio ferrireducens]
MAAFKDLSNALADEVLNDMADNFFGARKDIDDTMEYFESLSKQLFENVDEIFESCALLQKVCLGEVGYKEFWDLAGINPELYNFPEQTECSSFDDTPSFSLTNKTEYTKWVSIAYHQLARRIEAYMNGLITDNEANHGRKMRSLNRMDFYLFAEDINRKIDKVNKNISPSDVLKFTKSLDPETVVKENITGCVGPDCSAIDSQMAFKPIVIEELGLPEFPDLPDGKHTPPFIQDFCSQMYSKNKSQVKVLLEQLQKSI